MGVSHFRITTLAELRIASESVLRLLKSGDVVGLDGALGTGKTTFVKEIAHILGIAEDVISPTFIYEQIYVLPAIYNSIERVIHTDLYRLQSDADIEALGLTTDDEKALIFVEWIGRAPLLARRAKYLLKFEFHPDSGERSLICSKVSHD